MVNFVKLLKLAAIIVQFSTKTKMSLTAALLQTFNTNFLNNALQRIVRDCTKQSFITHVGSVESWPQSNIIHGQNAAMIFNTEYATEAGEHWLAVYIEESSQTAFLFDSLPVRPFPQQILGKLQNVCKNIINTNPENYILQNPEYPLCGIYCLAFLYCCTHNEPFFLCANNQTFNDVTVLNVVLPYLK